MSDPSTTGPGRSAGHHYGTDPAGQYPPGQWTGYQQDPGQGQWAGHQAAADPAPHQWTGTTYGTTPAPGQWADPQYGTDPAQQLQPYRPAAQPAYQHFRPAVATRQPVVTAGGRFGAFLLDVVLALVTLWIGWFVWSMVTWSQGQTPGKKLLGHVVVDPVSGQPFDWGRMALRQFVIGGLLGSVFNALSFGIYFWVDSFMVLSDGQRTLHDRMANSIVVHETANG